MKKIRPIYKGRTAIIAGTGPSITQEILDICNDARAQGKVKIFGANLAYRGFDVDVLHGCNSQFWEYYLGTDPILRNCDFDKWTTRPELINRYPGLNYIQEIWADGLSTDPDYIHAHHGTGPQVINIALHYGIKRMLLVGWDMSYPKDYDGQAKQIGSGKRHYFGEYPAHLQHWPSVDIVEGKLNGLIREMETIKPEDYGIEIINCTEGSAMKCFPFGKLTGILKGVKQ